MTERSTSPTRPILLRKEKIMPETFRVSPNQSIRYLALLQERIRNLKRALAKKEELIRIPLPRRPPGHPKDPLPPPTGGSCSLLKLKPFGDKRSDEILAAIYVSTAEAVAATLPAPPEPPRK